MFGWAEIAFLARQNDENVHSWKLKKQVLKVNISSEKMLLQDFRGGIRVLLHDSSGFAMPAYLSLANRPRAFYIKF